MTRKFEPRAYQRQAIDHLLALPRCALWASMGAGKTTAALTAAAAMILAEGVRPLVLAPRRVALNTWPDEAAKWSHLAGLRVAPLVGTLEEIAAGLRTRADVYTTNYDRVPYLVETLGKRWPFDMVIADESTRLKSFRIRQGGQRAQALAKIERAGKIRRFVELTGTPSPNGLQDLWGQAWFLDRGFRLGTSFDAFERRWFRTNRDGYSLEALPGADAEIRAKLADLCLTIDVRDHLDIREPITTTIPVRLPPAARNLYRDMERRMFAEIEGHPVEAFNAASRTMKCLQLANGAAYVDEHATDWREVHTAKLEALESVIEEAAGSPVLVAYHFKSDLARLRRAFPRGRALDQRPETIREWNAGRVPILFVHPASGGHGLNLQDGGHHLAFFGLNWNLEEHLQVIERIGPTRQAQAGHDRPVWVYYLAAEDTVDELVLERLRTKRAVQDILLDAMKRK